MKYWVQNIFITLSWVTDWLWDMKIISLTKDWTPKSKKERRWKPSSVWVIFVESSSIRNMLSLKRMQPRQTAQNWVVSCLD